MKHYFAVLILICGGLLAAGCDSSSETAGAAQPRMKETLPVQVITARHQAISRTLEVTGDVVAVNTVTIQAGVEGPIALCPGREGDQVKKGALLVEIDRPVYREEVRGAEAALAVARARLADLKAGARKEEVAQAGETVRELESCAAFAKNDLERMDKLVKTGALPGESLEKAQQAYTKCETSLAGAREKMNMLKAGPTATDIAVSKALVQEAEAKLDMARAKLAECILTAPFDGVITRAHVRPGDTAQAKAPLLELMETASIVVCFSVPESLSRILKDPKPASVRFDALPGKNYTAHIVRVYPEIDPNTRTRPVEARVEGINDLVPGMFARVFLTTDASDKGVVVPDRALVTKSAGKTVAFVVVNDTAEQRSVKTGIENGSCIQVTEGLIPGDIVIIAGHEKLKTGTKVKTEVLKNGNPCLANASKGA